jgi:prolyl-tRNA editing enzyme YbaK/EbsC (Cys-tRNA(Pro) deacylase)
VKNCKDRVEEVLAFISKHKLDAQIIWHRDKTVLSLEDALEVHGLDPGNVLKCLLLKGRGGKIVAVMVPGDVRIDVKKLERLINVKKLSFLPSTEMEAKFGLEPGGVDPLILPEVADVVVVEKTLMERDFVVGSGGSKFCGLRVNPDELLKVTEATILDFSGF